MNAIKTAALIAVMTFLLMALGGALGGRNGIIMALIFAGVGNFILNVRKTSSLQGLDIRT